MPGLGTRRGKAMSRMSMQKRDTNSNESDRNAAVTIVVEVEAAYNRDCLPMPAPNGPNGRRVLNLEMLMHHPFYWEWLNERETEEVLMELYIARTRRAM